jgi:AbrB family looped-hinge helix DNA binding protein
MTKVQNVTSKGQITLPATWRKQFPGSQIILKVKDNLIEISPVTLSSDSGYTTVFDAIRDNKGKGLKAAEILKMLSKK